MTTLTIKSVEENPELALYGIVFSLDRTEAFTRESIEREIDGTPAGSSMKPVLGRCLKNWLDNELLYRCSDGYMIAL